MLHLLDTGRSGCRPAALKRRLETKVAPNINILISISAIPGRFCYLGFDLFLF